MVEYAQDLSLPTPAICQGVSFALQEEKRLFPETSDKRNVTLTLTKAEFLRLQKLFQRHSKYLYGNYDAIVPRLKETVLKENWNKFAERQILTLFTLERLAEETLFGTIPSIPDGWLDFEKAETTLDLPIERVKDIVGGLLVSLCETAVTANRFPDTAPKTLNGILDQLQSQGVKIETDRLNQLQEAVNKLSIFYFLDIS